MTGIGFLFFFLLGVALLVVVAVCAGILAVIRAIGKAWRNE